MAVKNMQNSFPYIDILIFGVIAIFLIFRLKNILGTKTGFEETNVNDEKHEKNLTNVVSLKSDKKTLSTFPFTLLLLDETIISLFKLSLSELINIFML